MSQLSFYKTMFEAKWLDRSGREPQIQRTRQRRFSRILDSAKQVPFQSSRLAKYSVAGPSGIPPTGKQEMFDISFLGPNPSWTAPL